MQFKKEIKKSLITTILALMVIVGIFFSAYFLGVKKGAEELKTVYIEGVSKIDEGKEKDIDFNIFWEAWSTIKEKYVSKEKTDDNQKLIYGAISGLVDSLGDKNSIFFSPKDAQKFTEEISGEFEGIGAELGTNKDGQIIIIAPLKNTPAYKAGIKSGDKILKIDGKTTAGMTVDDAVKNIRGEKGTKVDLTIQSADEKKERVVSIIRDSIQVPTLDLERINYNGEKDDKGEIGYIKIYNFYEKSPSLFYQAALKILMSKLNGIVIDLRGNPGGFLEASVNIGSWFIEKNQPIVKEEFRDSKDSNTFYSTGPALLKDIPVVVIIDRGSASASEILAGALKEKANATLIGEKSFGKGTVQELMELGNGAMMKLTIAHWLTPNGKQIDENGITPDIVLKIKESKTSEDENSVDEWLKKSAEILKSKILNSNQITQQ